MQKKKTFQLQKETPSTEFVLSYLLNTVLKYSNIEAMLMDEQWYVGSFVLQIAMWGRKKESSTQKEFT